MPGRLERTYGKIFKYTLFVINPFKKALIRSQSGTHEFINIQALEILKNDNYLDAYCFFSDYIVQLNEGVVWADKDLKSAGHFYNPEKNRGLYGNRDALSLAVEYYGRAVELWKAGDVDTSMFYLGAAVHIVQDMTIPQHANIRLLDNHRQYERFIRRTYMNTPVFAVSRGGYYLASIEEFTRCNARVSMKIYARLHKIKNETKRFYTITKFILPLAQKTTAGCFMRFYRDTSKMKYN